MTADRRRRNIAKRASSEIGLLRHSALSRPGRPGLGMLRKPPAR